LYTAVLSVSELGIVYAALSYFGDVLIQYKMWILVEIIITLAV